jgi:squalene-hopene/tetraprenyl-beta-curcumene cyclase
MSHLNRRAFIDRSIRTASLLGLASCTSRARGAETDPTVLEEKAVSFLRPRQTANGSWSADRNEPGITALVVTAMLRSKRVTSADPAIVKGLSYLEGFVDPKGGLAKAPHSVYSTSVALMAFQEANKGGRYDSLIKGAQGFLKVNQTDEGEGKTSADPAYGGSNYGGGAGRPDLSNTSFMMEALRDSGLPADDPALQKALVFVSRCQNLKSEFNDQPWAGKVNDGGFIYVAAGRGEGGAGKVAKKPDDPIPSNAGMTYAGLKSMIYAGLRKDDVRVKAALGYITKHYTVEENPGQGQRGLYYYYHTFARALAALGEPTLVDAEGKKHDWRSDLIGALAKRQEPNGGWVNREDRFMEGDPNIVTSYGLLALAAVRPKS